MTRGRSCSIKLKLNYTHTFRCFPDQSLVPNQLASLKEIKTIFTLKLKGESMQLRLDCSANQILVSIWNATLGWIGLKLKEYVNNEWEGLNLNKEINDLAPICMLLDRCRSTFLLYIILSFFKAFRFCLTTFIICFLVIMFKFFNWF